MTHEAKRKMKVALSTALLVGATAVAGNVTLPNTFVPNTPARAAEVNANFTAVKTAVDDNFARLQTVEGQVTPLQSTVTGLSSSVTAAQGNISTLQSAVAGLQGNVTTLQTNMTAVQGNVTTLQTNVTNLQGNVTTLQTNMTAVQSTVATLNTNVTTLNNTTWRRTGNLGTNPATDYLGTADNTPLDLRVNATRVMRLAPGQVGINTTTLEQDTELVVAAPDSYANLLLRTNQSTAGGFLISVGDVTPGTGQANFYLDSYRTQSAPTFQQRRLRIDDLGRMSINRSDNFIAGIGNVPLMVGTDTTNGNGAYLTPGGSWTNASSRQFKHALQAVNTAAVLEKVVALPMNTWEYKGSTEGRHLGPMAEDFSSAFSLGNDARRIATVDEGGVALAAIQGLNSKLERENAQLRSAVEALERRLSKLENR